MQTGPTSPSPVIEADNARRVRQFAIVLVMVSVVRVAVAARDGFPDVSHGAPVENGAAELLRLGWPILLALLIHRLKWQSLMIAALVTMLAMMIHRLMDTALDTMRFLNLTGTYEPAWIRFANAFSLSTVRWRAIVEILGRVFGLLIDSALTIAAWRLAKDSRPSRREFSRGSPRSIATRLAVMGSLLFSGVLLGSLAWDAYIEVLSLSPRIRHFAMRESESDARMRLRRRQFRAAHRPGRLLELVNGGIRLSQEPDADAARTAARNALRQINLATERRNSEELKRDSAKIAMALNNLSWNFATGGFPDQEPDLAVSLARESLRLAPDDGATWNTLGVALLRASSDREAVQAFERSMELRHGGDSVDWLFLAILRQRAGKTKEAKALYDRSLKWDAEHRPHDQELWKFEAEAAAALGLPAPVHPQPQKSVLRPPQPSGVSSPSPWFSPADAPPRKSANASGSM